MSDDLPERFHKPKDLLERIFEEIEKMMSEFTQEELFEENGRFVQFGPFTYGYSITIGPNGKPKIKEFGNLMKPSLNDKIQSSQRLFNRSKSDEKDSLVDVFTRNEDVKVIAEIPRIEESDISVRCTEDSILILVQNEEKKRIKLSVKVDPNNYKFKYQNGILEITIKRIISDGNSKIQWNEV